MAASTALSFSEYLTTSFPDLDREYVDGEVRERSMPDFTHSRIQARLAAMFESKSQFLPWLACTELRLLIRPGLVLIPDITIYCGEPPTSNPPTAPPLVLVEIVSRDDRHVDLLRKLEVYRKWGVPNIWVVDPWLPKLQEYTEVGLRTLDAFEIPGKDIRITLDQLLAGLPLS